MSGSCIFISCKTSPSAITLVASASTSSTRRRLIAHHHLEGARVEEIADQNARGIAEQVALAVARPRRNERRFVDDIVVQECGRVDEFHHGRQFVLLGAARTRSASANSNTSRGRIRLPPAVTM
jgi:hypothetical protein